VPREMEEVSRAQTKVSDVCDVFIPWPNCIEKTTRKYCYV